MGFGDPIRVEVGVGEPEPEEGSTGDEDEFALESDESGDDDGMTVRAEE